MRGMDDVHRLTRLGVDYVRWRRAARRPHHALGGPAIVEALTVKILAPQQVR